ncbi:argininosuccinate lyase [Streptomyces sp. YH02]|uniref:argininosuccinate lyase n=1 Tax=Streptomyces sp. YH02 TaxID=3256999 RepID=UPI003757F071
MTLRTEAVNTGRLSTALSEEAHRIVYDQYVTSESGAASGMVDELRLISTVDRAHLVMLAEHGIVDRSRAGALLAEIEALRASDFEAVRDRPIPRGVYLAYERYLTDTLGDEVGGVLHTGRSRNDLNATTVRLRTRQSYVELLVAVEHLIETLLEKAEEYRDVTMPAYTHGQPAVPITYGHYLAGVANAVLRGLDDLLHAGDEIDANPLGAGAVGGTSVPIDVRQTTELLGFAVPVQNSVDAVASREFVLRLLCATSVLGTTLSRVARDLSSWSSEEVGLLRVADDLVGSSSMMPQKRNPFLLEHIQGRATASLGHLVSAASSMATAGYTNAIAVGTEAVRQLWPGLRGTNDAVTLMRLVIQGATPDRDRMHERCVDGYTTATYLAERMVLDGVPFRLAHHHVGQAVLASLNDHVPLTAGLDGMNSPSPEAVAEACAHGGGPGAGAVRQTVQALRADLTRLNGLLGERRSRWDASRVALDEKVRSLMGTGQI